MANIPMNQYQYAQEIDLLVHEMKLIGGPRASFEIQMIDAAAQAEMVVNYNADKPIYTLRIPRGQTGDSLRGMVQTKTSQQWTEINPVLLQGELGYETDTKFLKVGNGSESWTDLEYMYQNADELSSGLLSPQNLSRLLQAVEVTSNLDLGDAVVAASNSADFAVTSALW